MTAVDVDALEARGFCTCAGITPPHGPLCDAPVVTALLAEVRRGRARDEVLKKLIATAPVVWNGDYPVKAVPVSDLLSLDALAVLAAVDGGEQ